MKCKISHVDITLNTCVEMQAPSDLIPEKTIQDIIEINNQQIFHS